MPTQNCDAKVLTSEWRPPAQRPIFGRTRYDTLWSLPRRRSAGRSAASFALEISGKRFEIDAGTRRKFAALAKKWREETRFISSINDAAMHPAYQRIIGLGASVIPLILLELEAEADQWFWALRSITGENPAPPETAGDTMAMRAAWLEWGRRKG